jgi:hypothetical protein
MSGSATGSSRPANEGRDELTLAGEGSLNRYLNDRHIGFLQKFQSGGNAALVDVLTRCESVDSRKRTAKCRVLNPTTSARD